MQLAERYVCVACELYEIPLGQAFPTEEKLTKWLFRWTDSNATRVQQHYSSHFRSGFNLREKKM